MRLKVRGQYGYAHGNELLVPRREGRALDGSANAIAGSVKSYSDGYDGSPGVIKPTELGGRVLAPVMGVDSGKSFQRPRIAMGVELGFRKLADAGPSQ